MGATDTPEARVIHVILHTELPWCHGDSEALELLRYELSGSVPRAIPGSRSPGPSTPAADTHTHTHGQRLPVVLSVKKERRVVQARAAGTTAVGRVIAARRQSARERSERQKPRPGSTHHVLLEHVRTSALHGSGASSSFHAHANSRRGELHLRTGSVALMAAGVTHETSTASRTPSPQGSRQVISKAKQLGASQRAAFFHPRDSTPTLLHLLGDGDRR